MPATGRPAARRSPQATARLLALARPPEAAVFVNGRPDIAAALGAQGVQLAAGDLAAGDARRVFRGGWIGRSVHDARRGRARRSRRAPTSSGRERVSDRQPSRPGAGRARPGARGPRRWAGRSSRSAASTPARAHEAARRRRVRRRRHRGALASHDPAAAALALLAPWVEPSMSDARCVTVNGEARELPGPATLARPAGAPGSRPAHGRGRAQPRDRPPPAARRHRAGGRRRDRAGALRGRRVSRRRRYLSVDTHSGVSMTGTLAPDTLVTPRSPSAGRSFRSRLMVGTGKYRSNADMVARHRGVGRGDRHRRGAPRGSRPHARKRAFSIT